MGKQSIPQKLPSKMTQHLQSCSNASQAWEALTAARSNSDMLSAFQTKLNLTTLTQKVSLGARNRQTSLRLCDTGQRLLCNTGLQQGEVAPEDLGDKCTPGSQKFASQLEGFQHQPGLTVGFAGPSSSHIGCTIMNNRVHQTAACLLLDGLSSQLALSQSSNRQTA